MTLCCLLEDLKNFLEQITSDFSLPVALQKGDTERTERAPEVFKLRLPDSSSAKKKVPYIIIQLPKANDSQTTESGHDSVATIRLIITVYNEDEQEGSVMLLNIIDRIRRKLLRAEVVGDYFKVNRETGIDYVLYTDDTAPYYAAEIIFDMFIPSVYREVHFDEY